MFGFPESVMTEEEKKEVETMNRNADEAMNKLIEARKQVFLLRARLSLKYADKLQVIGNGGLTRMKGSHLPSGDGTDLRRAGE